MPRDYEITLILNSQLPEDGAEQTVKRYQDFLTSQNARVVNLLSWGMRKLAYEIAKHQQGIYHIIQFQAEPGVTAELDRLCRLDESVLRHMIVLAQEAFEPEPAEEEPAEDGSESDPEAGEDEEIEADEEAEGEEEDEEAEGEKADEEAEDEEADE